MPARKKGKTTLQRSMEALRYEGFIVAKTERWNPFAGKRVNGKATGLRHDLFGFIDLLALPPGEDDPPNCVIAIQVVNTHLPEHIAKIRENAAAQRWLACGEGIVIHNWKQRSKNKVKRWECAVIEVTA